MSNSTELTDCPSARGYRMPAEWESHAATLLAWPHEESDWPGKFAPIPWVYTEIVKALTQHEMVHVLARSSEQIDSISDSLRQTGVDTNKVMLQVVETDRSWVRDSGPIFVVNEKGERAILDWRFNAWAKYDNWTLDDQIPRKVTEIYRLHSWQPQLRGWRVVLEGGSIDVNGQDLMLATEECLLSTTQQRNPPLNRGDYERVFADYLGVKKVL